MIYDNWINILNENKDIKPENMYFKNSIDYFRMVEHKHEHIMSIRANQCIDYLKTRDIFMNNIAEIKNICKENDKYGKPRLSDIKLLGRVNARTIEYLYFAFLFLEHLQSFNKTTIDVVEIGGGYGGLCVIMSKICHLFNITINTYIIFDLPYVCKFQKKYTLLNGVTTNVQDIEKVDMDIIKSGSSCISTYCFDELSQDLKDLYMDKLIIPKANNCFFFWAYMEHYEWFLKKYKSILKDVRCCKNIYGFTRMFFTI